MKKISGVSEIMLIESELDISEFKQFDVESLLTFVDDLLLNQSVRLFCIDDLDAVKLAGKNLNVTTLDETSSSSTNPKLFIYEQLEFQSISIDMPAGSNSPKMLEVKLVNQSVFNDREKYCFSDYTFYAGDDAVDCTIESESSGSSTMKQLYLLDKEGMLYNIDLLNDDVTEELSAIQEML